jgi:23S rRNA (adenine2503-C2)-methyltransferase
VEAGKYLSKDGTVRYLVPLEDGKNVEAVFIPEERRDTICISSQVGCAVDCQFCLTAKMGLERNLTGAEIAGQVEVIARDQGLRPKERPLNIVLMGQGEPLLNLENVLTAYRILTNQRGLSVAPRRISLSTSGIVPMIDELAKEKERPQLAISLNASHQEQRERIMPVTRKWSLAKLLEACRRFPLKNREKLLFEYVLLAGVNDSDEDAARVVELLSGFPAVTLNLLPLNEAPGIAFQRPSDERVASFHEIVAKAMLCYVRKTRGQDVFAACGQLKLVTIN